MAHVTALMKCFTYIFLYNLEIINLTHDLSPEFFIHDAILRTYVSIFLKLLDVQLGHPAEVTPANFEKVSLENSPKCQL
jgi:hypothetical protein